MFGKQNGPHARHCSARVCFNESNAFADLACVQINKRKARIVLSLNPRLANAELLVPGLAVDRFRTATAKLIGIRKGLLRHIHDLKYPKH
jgi:hypothetical protein